MEPAHKKQTQKNHLHRKSRERIPPTITILVILAAALVLVNQWQVASISSSMQGTPGKSISRAKLFSGSGSGADLSSLTLEAPKSTGHTLAQVFPELTDANEGDVMGIVFPQGTPEYGEALRISFDDPINSLEVLAKMYRSLKADIEQSNPEAYERYINLASQPYGVSCEYCCGVGPVGADARGNSRCGCQHNPAVLSLTLWLAANTDYNDAEIMREVLKWKTLFFPKNMIGLAQTIAGGDASALDDLPGMVGGC